MAREKEGRRAGEEAGSSHVAGLVALLLLRRLRLRAQPGLRLLERCERVLVRGSGRAVGEPQAERAAHCNLRRREAEGNQRGGTSK